MHVRDNQKVWPLLSVLEICNHRTGRISGANRLYSLICDPSLKVRPYALVLVCIKFRHKNI
jgi:hypothetical protein